MDVQSKLRVAQLFSMSLDQFLPMFTVFICLLAYSLPLESLQVGVLQLVFLIDSSPRVTLKLLFRTEIIFLPISTGVVVQSAGMCEISTF